MDSHDFAAVSTVQSLLGLSDDLYLSDLTSHIPLVSNDWSEAVSGWKSVRPAANYQHAAPRKKKRNQTRDERGKPKRTCLPNTRLPSTEAQTPHGHNPLPGGETKSHCVQTIRCVDEDYTAPGVVAAWKANVEPVTYRYVPNNGFYRKSKYSKGREESSPRRHLPISLQQKHFQREIQRDLKRGFDPQISALRSSSDSKEGELTRERSKSDATLQYSDSLTAQALSPVPLPLPDDPWLRSAVNEKFLEGFSSRLSALDEEIKRDSQLFRKSRHEEDMKGPFLRARMKDSRISPMAADTLHQEIFSVKQLRTKQSHLRPLEKITPQNRIAEDLGKIAVAQLKYTKSSEINGTNVSADNRAVPAVDAPKDHVQYKLSHEFSGAHPGISEDDALHSAITTTKVIPNNKYSITKLLAGGKSSGKSTAYGRDEYLSPSGITGRIEKEYNADKGARVTPPLTFDPECFAGISGKRMSAAQLVYNR